MKPNRRNHFSLQIWYPLKLIGTMKVAASDTVGKILKDVVQRFPQHFDKSDLPQMRLNYEGSSFPNDFEIGCMDKPGEAVIILKGINQPLPECPAHSKEMILGSQERNYMLCYDCWFTETDETVVPIGEIPEPQRSELIENARCWCEEEKAKKEKASGDSSTYFKQSGPSIPTSIEKAISKERNLILRLAESGELNELNEFVEYQVDDVNIPNEKGIWAIHEAAHANNSEVINTLVENGCRADECSVNGLTPLIAACHKQNVEAALALLNNDCDTRITTVDGVSALHVAIQWGNEEIIDKILSKGYNDIRGPDGLTPLMMAAELGLGECFLSKMATRLTVTTRDKIGRTPLMFATTWEAVELLIREGANMRARDYAGNSTLMHLLTRAPCPNLIPLFASANVDINQQCSIGNTALFILVSQCSKYFPSGQEYQGPADDPNNFKLTLQRLLEYKADPNIGNSPLHAAVHNFDVFKALWKESNAQTRSALSPCNPKGRTLMMSAASCQNGLEVLRFLISSVSVGNHLDVDDNGDDILAVAAKSGCPENVQFLYFHLLLASNSPASAKPLPLQKSLFDSVISGILRSEALVTSNNACSLLSKMMSGAMSKRDETIDYSLSQWIYKAAKYTHKWPSGSCRVEIIELLRGWGGKMDFFDELNRNALFYVTDVKLADFLLENMFGDEEPFDLNGNGLLHSLIENDSKLRIQSSEPSPSDWDLSSQDSKDQNQDYMFTVTKKFLMRGCKLSSKNKDGITVLESAVIKLSVGSLRYFLDAITDCGMTVATEADHPKLLLHSVTRSNKKDCCVRLLFDSFGDGFQKWPPSAVEESLLEYLKQDETTPLVGQRLIGALYSVSQRVIDQIIISDNWFIFRIAFQKVVYAVDVEHVLLKCLETDSVGILGGFINCVGADNIVMSDYGAEGLPSCAIEWRAKNCLQFLLQRTQSQEANRRLNNGNTILHRAAEIGCCACVEIILSGGGRKECKNYDGETPVRLAIVRNYPRVVELLSTPTDESLNAYVDLAISLGYEEVMHALLSDDYIRAPILRLQVKPAVV
eukprot:TRINITY_DN19183_c0_g1_i1.p1 TRINITY_DN19183_c0_g1~~TRINITY_DN19183_c0_g1_i1.p1  ORF type:complete len:1063 (+),score=164.18 TRINITY_DN19183_c0_g1_i1:41-3190(+)